MTKTATVLILYAGNKTGLPGNPLTAIRSFAPELAGAVPVGDMRFDIGSNAYAVATSPPPVQMQDQVRTAIEKAHIPSAFRKAGLAHQMQTRLSLTSADKLTPAHLTELYAVAGALAGDDALLVVDMDSQGCLPAGALALDDIAPKDRIPIISSYPLSLLACTFTKFQMEGSADILMCSQHAYRFGLPDLAVWVEDHDLGDHIMGLFDAIMRWSLETGHRFSVGDTSSDFGDFTLRFGPFDPMDVPLSPQGTYLELILEE
jgi:hypothetical protein